MDCNKNGKSSKCPFRMDDGRHFTDYRANTFINSNLRYANGMLCGPDYREYLQQNANKLMNNNSQEAWRRNGCGPCKNLCLGIDETKRPGNSSEFSSESCVPPEDVFRYQGFDGTSEYASYQPVFKRPMVPSGAVLKND